uniref:Reverse transcriptase domain-containing protein n=1 Tax=Tanacetum cinerariifolium TaxID=118510 RepID=A0A6L2KAB4_TANCI|nr:hypothetical protein [Tanacetum cinerariifolium]
MLTQRKQAANLAVQQRQEEQAAQSFTPYCNFSMLNDVEVLQSREKLIKDIKTFLEKFSRISFVVMPKVLLIAWERLSEINHAYIYKRYQPDEIKELMCKLLEDDDEEYYIQHKEYLEKSPDAVTTVLPTEEPEYSPSMGYEHLSTIPEKESDEVTESSVKNLLPIPSEYEVTSDDKTECDVPVCENSPIFDDHSEILSNSNNDDILSDDDAFEDVEYVEASPLDSELVNLEEENVVYQDDEEFDLEDILQIQDVILCEKLLSINRLIADIESLNDNPTPDRVLNSSTSIPIFEEFNNSLSNNSLLEFDTFSDHTEETRSGSTTTHAPEYDTFCFEIEPDQGRLTSVVKNDISDDSLEEVNLFLALDNSIPQGIRNIDYDSEGDIHFLEELLVDDCISFPEMSHLILIIIMIHRFPVLLRNHQMLSFFYSKPDVIAEEISDRLNEDECFNPGGEINVFTNVEDDDYFPFIFVIRIFLPYLIYPEVSPLLLSAGNEDTIFDPGLSV